MATTPTWKLEAAFGYGPGTVSSAVWTDISHYLDLRAGFTWRRGRQHELDQIQPGQLTVTLDNSTGYFSPGSGAAGITLNTPVRLSAMWAGTYYPLALGYVDAVPVVWSGGVQSTVTLTATDRLKILSKRTLRSMYREQVLADGAFAYYPMDDPAGSSGFASIASTTQPIAPVTAAKAGAGAVSLAAVSNPLPGDNGGSAPTFTAASATAFDYMLVQGTNLPTAPSLPLGQAWTAELWFMGTATPSAFSMLFTTIGGGAYALVQYAYGLNLFVQAGSYSTNTSTVLPLNQWHHVVLVSDPVSGHVFCYTDGALTGTVTLPTTTATSQWIRVAGGFSAFGFGDYDPFTGSVAHVAMYPTALTAAQVAEHYTVGSAGMLASGANGVNARVGQIAQWVGAPTTSLDTASTQSVAVQQTAGTDAVSALTGLSTTEHGLIYMGPSDDLRFRSRLDLVNKVASFTVDTIADGIDVSTAFTIDDQLLQNDYTATRPSGSAARVVDTVSVANNGTYSASDLLLLTTDGELQDATSYRVQTHSQPLPRGDQVKVDPLTSPDLWSGVLGSDLGQMFTVTNLPAEAPASSMNLLIQQITATITATSASFQFDTSAVDTVNFLVLDDPTFGVLDANNALFF